MRWMGRWVTGRGTVLAFRFGCGCGRGVCFESVDGGEGGVGAAFDGVVDGVEFAGEPLDGLDVGVEFGESGFEAVESRFESVRRRRFQRCDVGVGVATGCSSFEGADACGEGFGVGHTARWPRHHG